MSKKNITAADLAKYVGVSQSTVSRIFWETEGRKVNPEIKKKVIEAAKKLGYEPNLIARSLASGKTNIIGLVTGGISGPYYNTIIRMIIKKFQEIGKQVLVFDSEPKSNIDDIVNKVLSYQVDGIIIMAASLSETLAEVCKNYSTPVILLNRRMRNRELSYVTSDHIQGGEIAAKYIVDKGFKSICYVGSIGSNLQEIEIKYGFDSILTSCSSTEITDVIKVHYDYQSGLSAGKQILALSKKPDVVFCTSDMIAVGAMDVLRNEGNLKIPQDICVIGYDNAHYAAWESYKLTSIQQDTDKITSSVVNLMKQLIKSPEFTILYDEIPLEIIERESTKVDISKNIN